MAQGEVIKFDGFLKVYMEDRDDDNSQSDETTGGLLPRLSEGETLTPGDITATQRFTTNPRASPKRRW